MGRMTIQLDEYEVAQIMYALKHYAQLQLGMERKSAVYDANRVLRVVGLEATNQSALMQMLCREEFGLDFECETSDGG